jgi:hypothetical protein
MSLQKFEKKVPHFSALAERSRSSLTTGLAVSATISHTLLAQLLFVQACSS